MNVNCCTGQHSLHKKEEHIAANANKTATTLLIVDDSPLIVKNLIELLEDIASITYFVSSGTYIEAIDVLSRCSPMIILLDINLPDKSGIVLLKYIKTFYPEIIVIMVTNQSENFYKNLCLEIGAHYFLDKSNDFDKLSALVASIIQ